MFRLAHISDPHIGPLPPARLRELASKRLIGYINWHRRRAIDLKDDVLRAVVDAVSALGADQIAVTGDLVNIALRAELIPARAFLEALGPPQKVMAVPGNHDAYVPGAVARASEAWAPFLCGDNDLHTPDWPTVRRRGPVALIGVNTARASGPFMATGHVSDWQAERLTERLTQLGEEGLFRVVLIHHPPVRGSTSWYKRLIGGSRVRRAVARAGAELILHGHTHLATEMAIPGPRGPVPVISVPAAGQAPHGHKPAAGYNFFEISGNADIWQVNWQEWRLGDGNSFSVARGRDWTAPSNR